jgi:predicted RNA-binding protein associated with RNAse of E/G family
MVSEQKQKKIDKVQAIRGIMPQGIQNKVVLFKKAELWLIFARRKKDGSGNLYHRSKAIRTCLDQSLRGQAGLFRWLAIINFSDSHIESVVAGKDVFV